MVVLQDTKARKLNTRKWSEIQKSDPGAEYEDFKEWSSKIWAQWARFKLKVFKKRKTLRRYTNNQNHQLPDVDVELEPEDIAQPPAVSSPAVSPKEKAANVQHRVRGKGEYQTPATTGKKRATLVLPVARLLLTCRTPMMALIMALIDQMT